jgi:nitroimidazol reductase NimA-like FMN-containing flavoprotein (pyridoxamine 5'-phosphate oxidase superfamily)
MRRHDRAMASDAEIEALLHEAQIGFLATSDADQPYINANLYWYDSGARRIYLHTATEGRTHTNVTNNPKACFTVAEMGTLLPADEALEFSVEYAGVVAFGRVRVVSDSEEARHGLNGLLTKYFPDLRPGADYRPITDGELERTAVYALDIEAWSGKRKAV